ncbi:hypothetical protein MTO96_046319 [Rhipicephalus appendiculatus]
MVSSVLEELLVHAERVSAKDLQCLDEEKMDCFQRLGILQPKMALREMRRVLYASYTACLCGWSASLGSTVGCCRGERFVRGYSFTSASHFRSACRLPYALGGLGEGTAIRSSALDAQCEALLRDAIRLLDKKVPGSELAGTRGNILDALEPPALRGVVRRDGWG